MDREESAVSRETLAAEAKRLADAAAGARCQWWARQTPLAKLELDRSVAALHAAIDRLAAATPPEAPAPIDMVLHCPKCGKQHIDADNSDAIRIKAAELGIDREGDRFYSDWLEEHEWTNPPHRSHLCHGCGHVWRPADVPTNGVAAVKTTGKADSSPPEAEGAMTDEQITAMLQELDEICRQHDVYEYGLPLGFDQPDFGITPHAKMIAAVRAAIDASRGRAGS